MAASSATLHEDGLPADVIDRHRAIVSIMEELEAVDWYDQRVSAATDPQLSEVLAHNRDEEKEHAAMTLEWLRRHDPALDQMLRTYLFTDLPITAVEAAAEAGGGAEGGATSSGGDGASGDLGIGSLRNASGGDEIQGGVR